MALGSGRVPAISPPDASSEREFPMPGLSYRTVQTARQRQRFAEEGAGSPVLLLHGFPEGAYSWRQQLPALARAGFRAIAPDQRGYAGAEAPAAVEMYDHVELALDVIALMDTLGIHRAPLVAHDWGAALAWNVALLHPDRVSAVVALSVPYGGRSKAPPLATLKRRLGDMFFYMLYFQEPGVAEAELEADIRESLRVFYYCWSGDAPLGTFYVPQPNTAKLADTMKTPPGLPTWLTEADLDAYEASFRASGFRGPLNWYRTLDRTWERTAHLADAKVEQPALFITGDRDPVATFTEGALARMPNLVPRLQKSIILPGVGHWTQQERPDTVNAEIIRFLQSL
jgi:pimeloyl-ACP methyl ester carboxylesterase